MENNITIGIDLGDKNHVACVLDPEGNEIAVRRFANTEKAISKFVKKYCAATVAIEACVHSPWISRLLESMGHKVYVGNPRRLRCIWDADDKTDLRDARMLARIARFDPKLMYPIRHRGKEAQVDLQVIKARDNMVKMRTQMINFVRSSVKCIGFSFPSGWSAGAFAKKATEALPEELVPALSGSLEMIQSLTDRIAASDKAIENMARTKYPETELLKQVKGVGPVTSLAFVLTIEDPSRFKKSREVGAYLGLVPRRDQSGATDKQLHITKAGDRYLRRLLVSCAQYILGPFGPDCDLRRHGGKISERGGKNAKRRAVVAVARKLSVLLHSLWINGSEYRQFYRESPPEEIAA